MSTEMLREGIEREEEIFKMNLKAALKKVGKKEDRNKVLSMLFLCPLLCVFIHPHSSKAKGLCHSVCVCIFKSLQSCLPLCDPMDCSPPGSSVQGIIQARVLKWVAIPLSRESSQPKD